MTVFLGIVGVLIALLWIPIKVRVTWEEQPCVVAGWLFLRIRLYPRPAKKKPEKKPADKQAKAESKLPAKETAAPSFTEMVGTVLDLVQSATGGLRILLRHLWVSRLHLQMAVASVDAAETAIAFGQMNAFVYSGYAVLQGYLPMHGVQIDIRPDFLSDQTRMRLDLHVKLRPWFALGGLLHAGAGFLRRMLRRKNAAADAGQVAQGKQDSKATSGAE